jgi:uncharacterized protein YceH (UPF0502 family)
VSLAALDAVDVRVLGSLIEKSVTTPDYYPLSLNALTLACNQSSNRDPVMQLEETAVLSATDHLRRQSLVRAVQKMDSRVMKYSHLATDTLELDARELAVMCVLMLRGPQTAGELKTRTGRLAEFGTIADIETTVDGLMARQPAPFVARLARQPGQKEARYAHLLSGEVAADPSPPQPASAATSEHDRVAALEATVEEMRKELADVRRQLDAFRKQFE